MRHTRILLALVLAVSVLAGCTGSEEPADSDEAPAVRPPPPPPSAGSVEVEVGDSWRYAGRDGSNTTVVVLAKDNGSVRIRSTTVRDGNSTAITSVFTEDTNALVSINDPRFGVTIPFEPPIPIIVPAEDHEYHGNISFATILGDLRQPVTARITYYGLENVTVPAGNFSTYHYAVEIASSGTYRFHQVRHLWFAPDIDQAVLMFNDGRTDELVSYVRAASVPS